MRSFLSKVLVPHSEQMGAQKAAYKPFTARVTYLRLHRRHPMNQLAGTMRWGMSTTYWLPDNMSTNASTTLIALASACE